MPIAEYNEKAQRYMQPGSTKFMGTKEAEAHNAAQGTPAKKQSSLGAVAGPIVASLRAEFKGLNSHLAFRFGTVVEAIQGTAAERRDELINRENVPVNPVVPEEPTAGKGFLETLKGLNPFKEGLGTKTTILLLAGALWVITQFGDKLIKPLAAFLKWADGDPTASIGTWTEKFKVWWAEKWEEIKESWGDLKLKLQDMKERFKIMADDMKTEWENLKVWWAPKWESFKNFLGLFQEVFTNIHDWVMSYDKDKSGVLEKSEIDTLVSDVWTKIKEGVWNTVKAISAGFLLAIIGTSIVKGFFSTFAVGAAKLGLFGILGLTALIGMGIWKLTDNIMTAYDDAITDEQGNTQAFQAKEFVARLLGGKDSKGGWINALTNAWDKALIGAATGAAVGSIVPGIGTAVGAGVGFLIGGVLGATMGKAGSEKIKSWIDEFQIKFDNATNALTSWFDRIVVAAKAIVTPGLDVKTALQTFDSGAIGAPAARKATLNRIEENNERIAKLKKEIAEGNTERSWYWSKSMFGEDLPYAEQIALMEAENFQLRDDIRVTSSAESLDLRSKIEFNDAKTNSILQTIMQSLTIAQGGFMYPSNGSSAVINSGNISVNEHLYDGDVPRVDNSEVIQQEVQRVLHQKGPK